MSLKRSSTSISKYSPEKQPKNGSEKKPRQKQPNPEIEHLNTIIASLNAKINVKI